MEITEIERIFLCQLLFGIMGNTGPNGSGVGERTPVKLPPNAVPYEECLQIDTFHLIL